MMVADKMSYGPNGLIRLIISHLPQKQKNATPKSRIFLV